MYAEDDCLALSGIQHFAFCRRQWALIHVEQQWGENIFTAQGSITHERAHDECIRERRGNLITVRGLGVHSLSLGLTGFPGRVRRPPTDPVNAMLSLFYTTLMMDCSSALEGVGLDPYVGFLHVDRPGRRSLALDLMEELRPVMVDRFVLTAINNRMVSEKDFDHVESGEVRLSDTGRKTLYAAWQERKRDEITHPYLKEKIPWGLVPHVQALLLARFIRGDLDGYPAFLWK